MFFGLLVGFIACVIVLFFAARLVYTQVLALAKAIGLPAFVISLFLVSFATSIPELFIGVTSALDGLPSLSLGDVLGANIVNLTFIAGLVILLSGKEVRLNRSLDPKLLALTFFFAFAPVALVMDGALSRLDGVALLALYVLFLIYLASNQKTTHLKAQDGEHRMGRTVLLFLLGVVLLLAASEGLIRIAAGISTSLHVAPFILGAFALAFSTSLPELTFGIRSALRKTPELSLADTVGSSVVNGTLILGLVAIIHPIEPTVLHSVLLTGFFDAAVFITFYFLVGTRVAGRLSGAILLILYFTFVSLTF